MLQKGDLQKVLSTSAILTLEYRIYRLLRRIVGKYQTKATDPKATFEQYRLEVYEMVGDAQLHHSLNYYFNIGESVLHYLAENKRDFGFVSNYFVSFLSLAIYCLHNNLDLHPRLLADKKKLRFAEGNNWYKYSMGNLNLRNLDNHKTSKKSSGVPTIYRRKPKSVAIESKSPPALVFASSGCKIAVMIAVGVPGMGVKRFFTSFAEQLARLCLDADLMSVSPAESTTEQLLSAIAKARSTGSRLTVVQLVSVVDVDTARGLLSSIRSLTNGSSDVTTFCVSVSSYRVEPNLHLDLDGKQVLLPFNSYFILTCLKRLLSKGGDDRAELAASFFSKVRQFADRPIDASSMRSLGFDSFIGFPFANSDNEQAFLGASDYDGRLQAVKAALQQASDSSAASKFAEQLAGD